MVYLLVSNAIRFKVWAEVEGQPKHFEFCYIGRFLILKIFLIIKTLGSLVDTYLKYR